MAALISDYRFGESDLVALDKTNTEGDVCTNVKSQFCACQMADATELTPSCGHKVPVLSSCVNRIPTNMPVVKGFVSGQELEVLRDTGCSGVVVQQSLVSKGQYNGKNQRCAFIDGSVHTFPIASVFIDAPFLRDRLLL